MVGLRRLKSLCVGSQALLGYPSAAAPRRSLLAPSWASSVNQSLLTACSTQAPGRHTSIKASICWASRRPRQSHHGVRDKRVARKALGSGQACSRESAPRTAAWCSCLMGTPRRSTSHILPASKCWSQRHLSYCWRWVTAWSWEGKCWAKYLTASRRWRRSSSTVWYRMPSRRPVSLPRALVTIIRPRQRQIRRLTPTDLGSWRGLLLLAWPPESQTPYYCCRVAFVLCSLA